MLYDWLEWGPRSKRETMRNLSFLVVFFFFISGAWWFYFVFVNMKYQSESISKPASVGCKLDWMWTGFIVLDDRLVGYHMLQTWFWCRNMARFHDISWYFMSHRTHWTILFPGRSYGPLANDSRSQNRRVRWCTIPSAELQWSMFLNREHLKRKAFVSHETPGGFQQL